MRDAATFWSHRVSGARTHDFSHWRGHGRWANDDAWLAIGRTHRRMFDDLRRLAGGADRPAPMPRRMLEWGPGGGANALAFIDDVDSYIGVDISSENLAECQQQVQHAGHEHFRGMEIDVAHPAAVLDRLDEPVDAALCTAVYQHFPSQAYGRTVTQVLCDMLRPGGLALIQIRYDDGTPKFATRDRDYLQNVITFTSYPLSEFWTITSDTGFTPLAVTLQTASNYAYYMLRKDAEGGQNRSSTTESNRRA